MVKNSSFILFAIILVFTACSSKSNYSRKPVTTIQINPSSKVIPIGQDFTVSLQTKVKDGKLKNTDVFIDNQLVSSKSEEQFSVTLNSRNYQPGNHTIKAVSYKTDGVSGTNYVNVLVPSDIIPKVMNYTIVKTLPHSNENFTEGFEFLDNILYEGTGNNGTSFVYAYKPGESKYIKSLKIDDKYFGEGITLLKDKIYQLTYKTKIGFVYDLKSFKKVGEFTFTSEEGWGLTNDGTYLIMSDGTSKINYIDPSTFKIVKSIEVTDNNGVIDNINELEYVDGVIYSNIWTKNSILKIDAKTGKVLAICNMESLYSKFNTSGIDVLNGIAYNRGEDLFYVTGKLWPKMFAVKFN